MRWDGKYRCLVIEFPVCLKNDSNPREQVWFPCLSTLAANYNWGSRQPPPLPGVKSRWDFFSFSSIWLLATFTNSQMGKADSLRSSKKPVASEGLSMFVVNWCFYISPSSSSSFHWSVSDQTTNGWAASLWGGEQLCLQKRPNTCSFRPGRILFCLHYTGTQVHTGTGHSYIWNTYPNNKISAIGELMINSVWNVKFDKHLTNPGCRSQVWRNFRARQHQSI